VPGKAGRSLRRVESQAKVTGSVEYVHNLEVPGMLHGKIFRSTIPHARLKRIDVGAASAAPGVERVITWRDVLSIIPDPYYGPAFHDQPILALEKVRYAGEAVAVVLSADPYAAQQARDLIQVDYEELPAAFDEVEAARPGAPLVHEQLRPGSMFADLLHVKMRSGSNVHVDYRVRRGDVEKAFRAAQHVFEDTFHTPAVVAAPLEPIVAIAEPPRSGPLTIHSSTQNPSFVRGELARLLGWPENRIRVRTGFLGGGFGGKQYIKLEAMAAACALLAGRPVKISLTMDEQFVTITRHATTIRMKTGVSAEGRILARECEIWWNGGAYADIGPRVTQKAGFTAAGPYDIENVKIDSYAVYTNLPPAGALRGFGVPQVNWAHETQADRIAHELGIDPLEFRQRNLLRNGRPQASGTVLQDSGTEEVLARLASDMRWSEPVDRGTGPVRRGRGVALAIKAGVTPTTSVGIVSLAGDGSCTVYAGTVDVGQGSHTVLTQLAAEGLSLRPEDVRVIQPDTDATPYDMGSVGSRSTFHMGLAVQAATAQIRDQLLELAAPLLGVDIGELELYDGSVVARGRGEAEISFRDLMASRFGKNTGNLVGSGSFTASYDTPDPETGQSDDIAVFWMIGGVGAEVAVDTETGKVNVTRLVNVADVGKAINPLLVSTQVSGGALLQFGYAMSEEMRFEQGQLVNSGLGQYKIPTLLDIPKSIEVALVEVPHRKGPFGAKGVGETGTLAVSAAIGNALFDALGVQVKEIPLTPERVLRAIRTGEGRPLDD
jgi:CO/xanthine dehydrogenase Mo-binding subunit